MKYSTEKWAELLEALHYTEQHNPNGSKMCHDVFDENGIPQWQYDCLKDKMELFTFFTGCLYMKQHLEGVG